MLDVSFPVICRIVWKCPINHPFYRLIILNGDKFIYRMGGCSCLAGDFMGMGDYAFDEPLECNERIIFEDMIHYTMVKTTF